MEKTYMYRKSILAFKYFIILVFFVLVVLTILNFQRLQNISYLYLVLAIFSIPIIYYVSQLSVTKIALTPESIRYQCYKKDYVINFKQITKIDVKSLDKFSAYINIHSNDGKQIFISIRLNQLDDFLRRLYQKLLDINHKEIANKKLFSFYKIAVEASFQFERLKKIITYYMFYLILNIVYLILERNTEHASILFTMFFIYLLLSFLAYIIIELVYFSPKVHTIAINQFEKIVDKSKASNILFYVWAGLSLIHILHIFIFTV